jgi:branched-chain amino acid transport system permease protein
MYQKDSPTVATMMFGRRRAIEALRSPWLMPAFIVLMMLVPLLPIPEFWITQLNYIGLYAQVGLGLVLLTGVSGLTSFGQAAFVGVGAYTTAYLTLNTGLSPFITLFIGQALVVVVAVVLGFLTLRMSGHYLPLATLAWALSLNYTMANMESLGKYDGLLGVPAINLFGLSFADGRAMYVLIWGAAFISAVSGLHLLN